MPAGRLTDLKVRPDLQDPRTQISFPQDKTCTVESVLQMMLAGRHRDAKVTRLRSAVTGFGNSLLKLFHLTTLETLTPKLFPSVFL